MKHFHSGVKNFCAVTVAGEVDEAPLTDPYPLNSALIFGLLVHIFRVVDCGIFSTVRIRSHSFKVLTAQCEQQPHYRAKD